MNHQRLAKVSFYVFISSQRKLHKAKKFIQIRQQGKSWGYSQDILGGHSITTLTIFCTILTSYLPMLTMVDI